MARQLLHRHQLTLPPDSPSQGSTPGEVEEERLRLNDQVIMILGSSNEGHKVVLSFFCPAAQGLSSRLGFTIEIDK